MADTLNQLGSSTRLSLSDPLYADVLGWLIDEARILDTGDFEGWLGLLAPDLTYVAPVRESTDRSPDGGTSPFNAHFDETYKSMELRVKRFSYPGAWAEDPPSRCRRFITNVVVRETDDGIRADSYLLLLRSSGQSATYEMISCERQDILRRRGAGDFELVRRLIVLDQVNLGMRQLSVFL